MKVMVIGSNGFIGRNVADTLSRDNEVIAANRDVKQDSSEEVNIDLSDKKSVLKAIISVKPQVIVSCVGIVENNEKADMNPVFTKNLLDGVLESDLDIERIVVMGSAAEYGVVEPEELPVSEEIPPRATSPYGQSKVRETAIVHEYREKYNLPIVSARIFNPIGVGMPERQIIPKILKQIEEIQRGEKNTIEISRLDSERDYIGVTDVAFAIESLIKAKSVESIYNIGLGQKTTNATLVDLVLKYSGVKKTPTIIETQADKEPLFASQAEISRIKRLGWSPTHSIEEVVKEIVDAESKH